MSWVKVGAVVLLFAVVGGWGWSKDRGLDAERRAREAAESQVLDEKLRARDVGVILGTYNETLRAQNEEIQGLLDEANANLLAVSEVQVTATDTVVLPVHVAPDSVWTEFDGPPLSGRISFYALGLGEREKPFFRLSWHWQDRLILQHFISSDGLLRVWAESASGDPRISYKMSNFEYQIPRLPQKDSPSRLRWLLGGVAVGVIGWELAR